MGFVPVCKQPLDVNFSHAVALKAAFGCQRNTRLDLFLVLQLMRLKKRRDFLRLSRSNKKWITPAFVLQMAQTPAEEAKLDSIRLGFTASRKVGGAVQRNRCKRRLRALSDLMFPLYGKKHYDYVLIARTACLARSFNRMKEDLAEALQKIPRKLDKNDD